MAVVVVALGCAAPGNGGKLHAARSPSSSSERSAEEERVLARITAARDEVGRRPAELVEDRSAFDTAARLIAGGSSPEDAIRTAMGRVAEDESTEVKGWVLETVDLDQVQLPSAFVEREEVRIAVVVVPRGAASQRQYLVCFFIVEEGDETDLRY